MRRTRQAFDEQLEELERRLVEMGTLVADMLDKAVRALRDHDVELAREVITADDTVDQMDLEIEQQCMRLLALQQPMSRDLRTIGTVVKVIADVERVGDYSLDIAKTAIKLAETTYFEPLEDIQRMADLVRKMMRLSLEALVEGDLERVHQVVALDDQVDRLWYKLQDQLAARMQRQPELVPQATALLLVARYLERTADHTVNIAERVAYRETGKLEALAASHGPEYRPEDEAAGESPDNAGK
jgi:phosphate transport system protein